MRFEVLEELGSGTAGVVYLARDTETGATVAVKALHTGTASREELLAARKITHKNVCRVNDLHREGDRFFISMEYVEGETLRSLLDRVARLGVEEMLRIGEQIMDGLEEAHRCGVVHRDLKPENVMIARDGTVKLMDFGFAGLRDPDDTLWDSKTGSRKYAAPEQVARQAADVRWDVYSLGVVLWEMVGGGSVAIPNDIEQVILKCMERKPAGRFQTVAEIRDAFMIHLVRSGAMGADRPGAHRARLQIVAGLMLLAGMGVASLLIGSRWLSPGPVKSANTRADTASTATASIAVLPFENLPADKEFQSLQKGIPESVTKALTRTGRFRVVERTRLEEVVRELQARPMDDSESEIRRVGSLLGAQYLVFGSFQVFRGEIVIAARFVKTETGAVVFSDTLKGKADDALALSEKFGQQILAEAKLR